jgi:hypothetical protein
MESAGGLMVWKLVKGPLLLAGIVAFALVGAACSGQIDPSNGQDTSSAPQQAGQPLNPLDVAKRVAAVRAAALTGDQRAVQANMLAFNDDFRRSIKLPDPSRPISHEAARAAVRPLAGVRSSVWIDQSNLIVMVDGAQYRNMETIDRVCAALAPLGDTLAVVINLQDVTATTSQGADTLSRNCQLPEGQRALMQRNRKIDVLDPATRRAFDAEQPGHAH